MQQLGTRPYNEHIQAQSCNAYYSEYNKLSESVIQLIIRENPRDAQYVIDDQSGNERQCGGKCIMDVRIFGKSVKQSEIDHKSRSAHKKIAEQLYPYILDRLTEQFGSHSIPNFCFAPSLSNFKR